MKEKISPLGHRIGEVYIPPKNGENGAKVGFVWERGCYRLATEREILAALQDEVEMRPLVENLSRRKIRQLKVQSGVRYLGQPKPRYT
ncbi:hypothetical protein A3B45_02970 [Candidatus Daviesbacteria bacterium RIFCSPLOWO2_01_FULL_39_12]|uniref:Uncharacterized protein n=1 Tax=Candidatus Daviesbacteria bacterium RIFCSPLOWO2_01_FULL_39_12 TaxID=1797785 RepID=A0A1F5KTP4_9BACT|nr:MAG: hypothetical protein A3D79_03330 [Candidatus Daviesbacteria bacterium RIFCSPHIGHO2_02_FULL_39_8]OGE44297.1 MAG: hypothetical protein A3B45_02970 [Candidatus Daviesbacteria bacterium RIFCSPLOWO2_01_FULL_39_12]